MNVRPTPATTMCVTRLATLMTLVLVLCVSALHAEEQTTATMGYDTYGFRSHYVSPLGGIRAYDHGHLGVETEVRFNGARVVEDAEFGPHGQIEEYTYSALDGRPQRTARRGFDGLLRPTELSLETDGASAYDYRASSFAFDERSFVTGYQRTDQAVGTVSANFVYSAQGELETFTWGSQSLAYDYDPRGNLIARSNRLGVPAHSASYDHHNHNPDWRYDGAGRLLADDKHTYQYDAKGRLQMLLEKDSGAWIAHYLYDDQGNRIRVLEPDRVTYVYRDDTGAVASEDVRDRHHQPFETREHVLFNGNAVLEVTEAADGTTENAMQFSDSLGNPAITWTAGKETVHEYSPFGSFMDVGASSPHEGAHGYTGHEDDRSGLTYMRARYYDAKASRFNQPDPGRDFDPFTASSWNLYQYARNNPASFVDPTGEAIIIGHLTVNQRNQILDGLQAFTGHTYEVNGEGKLKLAQAASGPMPSSARAKDFLDELTRDDYGKDIIVNSGFENRAELGGQLVELDFEGIRQVRTSLGDTRTLNTGAVLIHELAHITGLPDPDPIDDKSKDPSTRRGPAVELVNEIREQMGFAIRDRYAAENTGNGVYKVFFVNKKADQEGFVLIRASSVRQTKPK